MVDSVVAVVQEAAGAAPEVGNELGYFSFRCDKCGVGCYYTPFRFEIATISLAAS